MRVIIRNTVFDDETELGPKYIKLLGTYLDTFVKLNRFKWLKV